MSNSINRQSFKDVYDDLIAVNKAIVTVNKGGMVDAGLLPTTALETALSKEKILEIVEERLSNSFLLHEPERSNIIKLLRFNTERFISKYISTEFTELKVNNIFEKELYGTYVVLKENSSNSNENKEKDLKKINRFFLLSSEELCENLDILMDAFYLLQNLAIEKKCVIQFRDAASYIVSALENRKSIVEAGGEIISKNNNILIGIKESIFERVPAKIVSMDFELRYIIRKLSDFEEDKKLYVRLDKVVRKLLRAKHQMPNEQSIPLILNIVDFRDYSVKMNDVISRYNSSIEYIENFAGYFNAGLLGREIGTSHFVEFYKLISGIHAAVSKNPNAEGYNQAFHKGWSICSERLKEVMGQFTSQFQEKIELYRRLYNKVQSVIEHLKKTKNTGMRASLGLFMVFQPPFNKLCAGDIPHPDLFADTDELEHITSFTTRVMSMVEKMRLEEEKNVALREKIELRKEQEEISEQNNNNLVVVEQKFSKLAIEDEMMTISEDSTLSVGTNQVVEATMGPAITYASRVRRWFSDNVMDIFTIDPTYVSKSFNNDEKMKIVINHNFGLAIDKYIKKYGLNTQYMENKQFSLAGEIEREGKIQRGIFTLTLDRETDEVYHRFFTIKTTNNMIDEFVHKMYYDVDFPELGSVKNKKRGWDDTEHQEYEMNCNDGSHVLCFEDKVVEVADPKNNAILRGFAVKLDE